MADKNLLSISLPPDMPGLPLLPMPVTQTPAAPQGNTLGPITQRPAGISPGEAQAIIQTWKPGPFIPAPILSQERGSKPLIKDKFQHHAPHEDRPKKSKMSAYKDPNEGECTGPIQTIATYEWDDFNLRSTIITDSTAVP